jgi:hypothetical protein
MLGIFVSWSVLKPYVDSDWTSVQFVRAIYHVVQSVWYWLFWW